MNAVLIALLTLTAPRLVTTIAGTPGVPGYRDGSPNAPYDVFFDFGGPYGGGIAVGQENIINRREIIVAARR
jgi:hypothetical protein